MANTTQISMYSASVPVFMRMLKNARHWLDKGVQLAEQKKFDSVNLLNARLAPDMLDCRRQWMIATDHAKGAAARLAGVEVPKYEDNEVTVAEIQARLDKTCAFLETLKPEQFVGSETREIVLPGRNGERRFVGHAYLMDYALPNFYFHLTTGYANLRHQGVDIGKTDFLVGAEQRAPRS
jgi:hypothetical protein